MSFITSIKYAVNGHIAFIAADCRLSKVHIWMSLSLRLSIKRFDPAAACWSSDRPQQLSSYCLSTTNTLLAYWPFHTHTHASAHTHTCILSSASNSCQCLVFLWFCWCASLEKHDTYIFSFAKSRHSLFVCMRHSFLVPL